MILLRIFPFALTFLAFVSAPTPCLAEPLPRATESPWKNTSQLTLRVVDAATGKPITRFGYELTLEAEGRKQEFKRDATQDPVVSVTGQFILQAPRAGLLTGRITGGPILGGYNSWKEWRLTSDNSTRTLELRVETGVVAAGRVTEIATGRPIEGAKVAPIIFAAPIFVPDEDRSVTTDADGRYRLDGVDPELGVEVLHDDYASTHRRYAANEPKPRVDFAMRLLPLRRGRILTPDGKPVEGVELSGYRGERAVSAPDGSFAIRSRASLDAKPAANAPEGSGRPPPAENSSLRVSARKPGYLTTTAVLSPSADTPVVITMKPVPVAIGRVLDDQGRPLKNFTLAAGEGEHPAAWECEETAVTSPDGRFSIHLANEYAKGNNAGFTLYATAPGFALAEISLSPTDAGKPLDIRLTRGVTLRGTTSAPLKIAGGSVIIAPMPHVDTSIVGPERQALLRKRETSLRPDGSFELTALTPGRHLLVARAPGMTPLVKLVDVGETPAPLQLEFRRAGRIVGKLVSRQQAKAPTSFARGEVAWAQDGLDGLTGGASRALPEQVGLVPRDFLTDENGDFVLEDVPAGDVFLSFQYNITADFIGAETFDVHVMPGLTAEVHLGDPDYGATAIARLSFGDGSDKQYTAATGGWEKGKQAAPRPALIMGTDAPMPAGKPDVVDGLTDQPPQFILALTPVKKMPGMAPPAGELREADAGGSIAIEGITPGRYRLTVLAMDAPPLQVFSDEVDLKEGDNPVAIRLGGASARGKALLADGKPAARARVTATGAKTKTVRKTTCDQDGEYCVRFLPDDDYSLTLAIPASPDMQLPLGTVRTKAGEIARVQESASVR